MGYGDVVDGSLQFVELSDVRIAVRVNPQAGHPGESPDRNPPVVLLHSLGDDSTTWTSLVRHLHQDGRRAIALDLRGHGQSSWPGEYSFELMVTDAIKVIDHLKIDTFDLIGHSLGGHLALLIAGRYPDRVHRLVVEDPPPPPDTPIADLNAPTKPVGPVPFDWNVVALRRAIRNPDRDWWARLSAIRCPTLILGGGPTSHVDQNGLRDVAQHIATSRFIEVDVGHLIHRSQPERFAELVIDALT